MPMMVDSRKILLILCLPGILHVGFATSLIGLGIYSLASGYVLGACFCNAGNDLCIYFTLMATDCSGERSFSKLKMVD